MYIHSTCIYTCIYTFICMHILHPQVDNLWESFHRGIFLWFHWDSLHNPKACNSEEILSTFPDASQCQWWKGQTNLGGNRKKLKKSQQTRLIIENHWHSSRVPLLLWSECRWIKVVQFCSPTLYRATLRKRFLNRNNEPVDFAPSSNFTKKWSPSPENGELKKWSWHMSQTSWTYKPFFDGVIVIFPQTMLTRTSCSRSMSKTTN